MHQFVIMLYVNKLLSCIFKTSVNFFLNYYVRDGLFGLSFFLHLIVEGAAFNN